MNRHEHSRQHYDEFSDTSITKQIECNDRFLRDVQKAISKIARKTPVMKLKDACFSLPKISDQVKKNGEKWENVKNDVTKVNQ